MASQVVSSTWILDNDSALCPGTLTVVRFLAVVPDLHYASYLVHCDILFPRLIIALKRKWSQRCCADTSQYNTAAAGHLKLEYALKSERIAAITAYIWRILFLKRWLKYLETALVYVQQILSWLFLISCCNYWFNRTF